VMNDAAARSAAGLAVPVGEGRALFGNPIDVRRRLASAGTSSRVSSRGIDAGRSR
jgi:hypothetical protein